MLAELHGTARQVPWAKRVRDEIIVAIPGWAATVAAAHNDVAMESELKSFARIILRTQGDANFWLDCRWLLDEKAPTADTIGRWFWDWHIGADDNQRQSAA